MGRRRNVAIIYYYNENWIGGTYYIQNLIFALKTQTLGDLPNLIILGTDEKSCADMINLTKYPYIEYRPITKEFSIVERGINKLSRGIFRRNVISDKYKDLDFVFPMDSLERFPIGQRGSFWIPDFQEHYYPAFFSKEEIEGRIRSQQEIVNNGKNLVLSSYAAKDDFNKFYPGNKLNQFVLQFAVTHLDIPTAKVDISTKYRIPNAYFLCSNQFWIHKNHKFILRCIKRLKQQGIEITVVFTGKENDYRFPEYFSELKTMVHDLDIESNVFFLGFIDRNDQLALMKKSIAVIQPSLFEGWSTVIEDGMSMSCRIFASDIPANIEQLQDYPNGRIFSIKDPSELENLIRISFSKPFEIKDFNYFGKVNNYGESFLKLINNQINQL